MMTFNACVSAAWPKVSYAFMISSKRKWCVISLLGSSRLERTVLSSIGVLTV